MMQTSPPLKDTIRPAFNHTFYFPVRFFNDKVTSRRYLQTAFRHEMKAKGDIQIQVWHYDEASSTSLGVANISLISVLSSSQAMFGSFSVVAVLILHRENSSNHFHKTVRTRQSRGSLYSARACAS